MRVRVVLGVVVVLAVAGSACSGSTAEQDLGDGLETSESTATVTSAPSTTATSAEPATTLSELAEAELEVERVVEEWFVMPFDTSQGEAGLALEPLTGLIRQRRIDRAAQREADGQIERARGGDRIEVTNVEVDLAGGEAVVEACHGSDYEVVDAETGESLAADNPESLSTGEFFVELTSSGWKINEWYPSRATGEPIECEFEE